MGDLRSGVLIQQHLRTLHGGSASIVETCLSSGQIAEDVLWRW
jgi:hypothetical protein